MTTTYFIQPFHKTDICFQYFANIIHAAMNIKVHNSLGKCISFLGICIYTRVSILESILEILSYSKVLKTSSYKILVLLVLLFAFYSSIKLDFIINKYFNVWWQQISRIFPYEESITLRPFLTNPWFPYQLVIPPLSTANFP